MKISKNKRDAPQCCVCGDKITENAAIKFGDEFFCKNRICESEARFLILQAADYSKYERTMDIERYFGYDEPFGTGPQCCICNEPIEDGEEYYDFGYEYICGRCSEAAESEIFENAKGQYEINFNKGVVFND